MENIIYRACPSCNANNQDEPKSLYSKDAWKIKNCTKCNFVYLENTPIYDALVKDFAWESTSESEREKKKSDEPVRYFISKNIKAFRKKVLKRDKLPRLIKQYFQAGNVLDIGCASGTILSRLDKKFIPFGVEISEHLAAEGNKKLAPRGGNIIQADAISGTSQFDELFFEGIIMSAFLEHEINPEKLLTECLRVLKVGGSAIIKVPNYNCISRVIRGNKWCGFRYPDHVNYFTPASLQAMSERVGFSTQQFKFSDKHILSDNMWIVLTKK
jgi:SAM-dependent methyltransferase